VALRFLNISLDPKEYTINILYIYFFFFFNKFSNFVYDVTDAIVGRLHGQMVEGLNKEIRAS
jgi:hypothetical protein